MIELHLTDIHFPYHDKETWEVVLDVAADVQPDIVHLGGDIHDFYQVSDFSTDPKRRLMLQEDLDVGYTELQRLRGYLPNAKFVYQLGNHEDRMRRWLWTKGSEVSGLRGLEMATLLRVKDLGIDKLIAREEDYKVGELYHDHGDEYARGGDYPAKNVMSRAPGNTIFGHHHKVQVHYMRLRNGIVYGAWGNGCLCTLTPEYVKLPQWSQSIGLIDYTTKGTFHVDIVPFFRHDGVLQCVLDGKTYSLVPKAKKEKKV